jgi:hypothetical protein
MENHQQKTPKAYVPNGAKINLTNLDMQEPITQYEKRKSVIPREQIKKEIDKRDNFE